MNRMPPILRFVQRKEIPYYLSDRIDSYPEIGDGRFLDL